MSTEPKTKRRDDDPVRVYPDGRLWYWTGGRPGAGERVPERCGTLAKAEVRAAELRALLARAHGLGPQAGSVLDQAMQDMLAAMRTAGEPEGSIRQYQSNYFPARGSASMGPPVQPPPAPLSTREGHTRHQVGQPGWASQLTADGYLIARLLDVDGYFDAIAQCRSQFPQLRIHQAPAS